jgi:diaminohydroxyphosphoribosylaminopyrimidine deaminase/5-amino-6-(5-phosphoribosylamino)uracil reductase
MGENDDNKFMRRCLELASGAEGMTYPNPMVGSVIVRNGNIIGEGFHLKAGGPHAEVIAINSVADKSVLDDSTLYVNLEPCSHFGKTPPCSDYIIANSIPKVVIGTTDTSEKVSGEGIKKLKAAGCEVVSGVIEEDCRWLNRRFFTFNEKKRPYITLKWAQSADGYIDIVRSDDNKSGPHWISGKPERVLVHKWRASEQAILVGAGTLRSDNPALNVREWKGNDPLRIILSSSGKLDVDLAAGKIKSGLLVFTHNAEVKIPDARMVLLSHNSPSSFQIAEYLYKEGIQSLFIEGGAMVLNHFIESGLWDEARIFRGKSFFNSGIQAPLIKGYPDSVVEYSGSTLETYRNTTKPD